MDKYDDASWSSNYTFDNPKYDEATHSITVVFACSQGKDRIGDYLEVAGIELENHRRNPVAFLDHGENCKLPIGKCVDPDGNYTVTIDEEAGTATAVVYLAYDVPEFVVPEQCFELYKSGVLRAGSIGYRPLEVEKIKADPENGYFKDSLHLKRVELLEVSLVGLPMNQDAVSKMDGKRFDACFKNIWGSGVNKHMEAMSATDQSAGGSFVGCSEELEKRLKLLEASHKELTERMKSLDDTQPADGPQEPTDPSEEVKALLAEVKGHLEEAADHDDSPDELREAHKHFAKAIGAVGTGNDEPDEGSHEVEVKSDDIDEDKADDEPDMPTAHELVKAVQTHLEESAAHPDQSPIMAAAHKYYAAKCDEAMKAEPEENLSPEQESEVMKALTHIARKLGQAERKIKGRLVNSLLENNE